MEAQKQRSDGWQQSSTGQKNITDRSSDAEVRSGIK